MAIQGVVKVDAEKKLVKTVLLRANSSMRGVVGSRYPYSDISSALRASKVINRRLGPDRCNTGVAEPTELVVTPIARSLATTIAVRTG
jgi:hypothetical protein